MGEALNLAVKLGLKHSMDIIVPNLTLGMAESAGPKVMENVVGAVPWAWRIPELKNFERGKKFVADFAETYRSYPSSSAASAYSILYEYKAAVERAGTFDTKKVIKALEGHKYTLLKDEQLWRKFDHQNTQSVYAVKGKLRSEVLADKFQQDYFEIIADLSGSEAARTKAEWLKVRKAANMPESLE